SDELFACFLFSRVHPRSSLVPYTTLFRSTNLGVVPQALFGNGHVAADAGVARAEGGDADGDHGHVGAPPMCAVTPGGDCGPVSWVCAVCPQAPHPLVVE